MRDTVNRFDDAANFGKAIRSDLHASGRSMAVDVFAVDELALEVGRNVVDTPNFATIASGIGKQTTCRAVK